MRTRTSRIFCSIPSSRMRSKTRSSNGEPSSPPPQSSASPSRHLARLCATTMATDWHDCPPICCRRNATISVLTRTNASTWKALSTANGCSCERRLRARKASLGRMPHRHSDPRSGSDVTGNRDPAVLRHELLSVAVADVAGRRGRHRISNGRSGTARAVRCYPRDETGGTRAHSLRGDGNCPRSSPAAAGSPGMNASSCGLDDRPANEPGIRFDAMAPSTPRPSADQSRGEEHPNAQRRRFRDEILESDIIEREATRIA